jgi:hypothetical protein
MLRPGLGFSPEQRFFACEGGSSVFLGTEEKEGPETKKAPEGAFHSFREPRLPECG